MKASWAASAESKRNEGKKYDTLYRLRTKVYALTPSPVVVFRTSRFLRLPTEIRLRIYDYTFTTSPHGDPLGLLRTCRQIYCEAYPIALPRLTKRFRVVQGFVKWWKTREEEERKAIRRVKFWARNPADIYRIPEAVMRLCDGTFIYAHQALLLLCHSSFTSSR